VALSRWRTVAAAGLIVALALVVGSGAVLAPETTALTSMTTLTVVDGHVAIHHRDGDFASAHEGDVVAAGDVIRTGKGASAEITYFDGSSLRLEGSAELRVERLRTEQGGATAVGVMQTLGRAWDVVTKLTSGGSRYDVRAPSSTASVRG
jgi:hypothetical protein